MTPICGNAIYYGIKTGCNDAFIVDQQMRDHLISEDPASADLLKPVLRGRDIRRYCAQWGGLWLIATFPSGKIDIDEYPAIKRHLLSYGRERLEQVGKLLPSGLRSRKKTAHEWYELQDTCAYHEQFEKRKLLWMHMSPEARFCCVPAGIYCNQKAFMISGSPLNYLCAVLNCSIFNWYIRYIAVTTGMGLTQWDKFVVEQLPIPICDKDLAETIARLVDDRLCAENAEHEFEIEAKLDDLVLELYGLSRHDRSIWTSGSR